MAFSYKLDLVYSQLLRSDCLFIRNLEPSEKELIKSQLIRDAKDLVKYECMVMSRKYYMNPSVCQKQMLNQVKFLIDECIGQ